MEFIRSQLFQRLEHLMCEKKLYLYQDLTNSKLADELQTEECYLSNVIHRMTGNTIDGYINEFKIKHAIDLLKTCDKKISIDSIAAASGFNSASDFCRFFRNMFGFTPDEYLSLRRKTDD